MTKPTGPAGGATFELSALDRDVRGDPAYLRHGQTARTLLRETDRRIVPVVVQRHDVEAIEESAFLLSLAGKAS